MTGVCGVCCQTYTGREVDHANACVGVQRMPARGRERQEGGDNVSAGGYKWPPKPGASGPRREASDGR